MIDTQKLNNRNVNKFETRVKTIVYRDDKSSLCEFFSRYNCFTFQQFNLQVKVTVEVF